MTTDNEDAGRPHTPRYDGLPEADKAVVDYFMDAPRVKSSASPAKQHFVKTQSSSPMDEPASAREAYAFQLHANGSAAAHLRDVYTKSQGISPTTAER